MNERDRNDEHNGHDRRNKFTFDVDGEHLIAWSEGDTAELKVREVLDMSGNQPAEDYYLVAFLGHGHKERTKHENLDELLLIKDHSRFAAVFKGATPVS
jgi:hypothetical protein